MMAVKCVRINETWYKMAVAAGSSSSLTSRRQSRSRGRRSPLATGSLVLRRRDRPGHKRGLVRAKKHGTKSGSGALLRRGFLLEGGV